MRTQANEVEASSEPTPETKWFRGRLEGYYVGRESGAALVSPYASAERYKLRIYRAVIRDIEILDDGPLDEAEGECFYQGQIEDVRLFGVYRRSCLEGAVYDVSVANFNVTHSTRKANRVYGRMLGEVHGRFLLPPPPPEPEAEALDASEESPSAERDEALAHTDGQSGDAPLPNKDEPLHPPDPEEDEEIERRSFARKIPFAFLTVVVAIVLGFSGGAMASLFWLGMMVPIGIIRLLLEGMFKVTNAQRAFGAVLILAQAGCLAALLVDWWSLGCKSVEVWPMAGVLCTFVLAAVLPSAIALLGTGAGLAIGLFLWFADVGVQCQVDETQAAPVTRPKAVGPGTPRTNDDGSWPRRPPGSRR